MPDLCAWTSALESLSTEGGNIPDTACETFVIRVPSTYTCVRSQLLAVSCHVTLSIYSVRLIVCMPPAIDTVHAQ